VSMTLKLTRVEYLSRNIVVKAVDLPKGKSMPFSSCLALARQGIQDCWRKAQGAMQPMKRDAPSPDVVRVFGRNRRRNLPLVGERRATQRLMSAHAGSELHAKCLCLDMLVAVRRPGTEDNVGQLGDTLLAQ
jgi:hypothetical protein